MASNDLRLCRSDGRDGEGGAHEERERESEYAVKEIARTLQEAGCMGLN